MRLYETMYLVNPRLDNEGLSNIINKLNNVIEKNNGVIIKVDEWGKRSLAYKIMKFDTAYYVLLYYCGDSETPSKLQRVMKQEDGVIKYQTIKLKDEADPDAVKAEMIPQQNTEENKDTVDQSEIGNEA